MAQAVRESALELSLRGDRRLQAAWEAAPLPLREALGQVVANPSQLSRLTDRTPEDAVQAVGGLLPGLGARASEDLAAALDVLARAAEPAARRVRARLAALPPPELAALAALDAAREARGDPFARTSGDSDASLQAAALASARARWPSRLGRSLALQLASA